MNYQKLKQYLPWIMVGILTCAFVTSIYFLQKGQQKLTKRDAEVQQLDTQVNIAESNLLAQRELNHKALSELSKEVQDLVKKYDLELQSRDETIAKLVSSIKGGSTNVTIEEGSPVDEAVLESITIGYTWKDKYKRFTLKDPNIWKEGDELFSASQHLKIKGYVFQGKKGRLQTRHIQVKEIYQKGKDSNGDPIFAPVPNSSFELVDATFDYVDPKVEERGPKDIFALRPYASFDTALSPGIGLEFIQLGRWLEWTNVGIGAELSADISDPLGGSLQYSRIGLSAHYHFIPPLLGTNMALGAGLSLPFMDLTVPVFTIDALFYLSDPIPLFGD